MFLERMLFVVLMVAAPPCLAADRFLVMEYQRDVSTITYDLDTVQFLLPGRFSIVGTKLDNSDVMKFKIKVADVLASYCDRPAGNYPASPELFVLGKPDLVVKALQVNTNPRRKSVIWYYPYQRMEGDAYIMICKGRLETEWRALPDLHAEILNGRRSKELFDCKRGITGHFRNETDDPALVWTHPIRNFSLGERLYVNVCRAVQREDPYLAER